MSTLAIPNAPAGIRKLGLSPWLLVPAVVILALGALWAVRQVRTPAAIASGQFHHVTRGDLIVRVAKDGELQAVNNIEIRNAVEGRTLVQTLVPEGSTVAKGDVLLVLDSSAITQQIDDAMLEVERAEADLTTAQETLEIQRGTNAANLESAKVELLLAQLDLEAYVEGNYPQALADARRAVEMAELTRTDKEKNLEQTMGLFAKGFVNAADVEKAKVEVLTANNDLEAATTALVVLEKYTHQKDLADKKNILAQAEAKLERVRKENASNLSQKVADERAKSQTLLIRKRKLETLQRQLAACVVVAPTDGLVVHAEGRRNEDKVQEGAEVREKQILIKLPDTSKMKAVVRIVEAQVHKLQVGQRARVRIAGVREPIWATLSDISVMSDSASRWWNPDLKEYPVDLLLDTTPAGLKPGLGVQAEIFVDQKEDVMTVPLPSIYSAGTDRYVFVRNGNDVKPAKVILGTSNETHAEVTDGLQEGAEVLMLQAGQGRELLERHGIAVTPPAREREIKGMPGAPNGAGQPGTPAAKATPATPATPAKATPATPAVKS